jgi:hypothetical protein
MGMLEYILGRAFNLPYYPTSWPGRGIDKTLHDQEIDRLIRFNGYIRELSRDRTAGGTQENKHDSRLQVNATRAAFDTHIRKWLTVFRRPRKYCPITIHTIHPSFSIPISMTQKYHDGKRIIEETETIATNANGSSVRRRETVLEDGTRLIEETPLSSSYATAPPPGIAVATAPIEEPEIYIPGGPTAYAFSEVPFAHATSVPAESPAYFQGASGSTAVVTGPPQPPAVAVVTGAPRPPGASFATVTGPPQPPPNVSVVTGPPANYSGSRYRDNRGGLTCCGITCIVLAVIFVCCVLPLIVILIIWIAAWDEISDAFDDDYWQDGNINFDDNFFNDDKN